MILHRSDLIDWDDWFSRKETIDIIHHNDTCNDCKQYCSPHIGLVAVESLGIILMLFRIVLSTHMTSYAGLNSEYCQWLSDNLSSDAAVQSSEHEIKYNKRVSGGSCVRCGVWCTPLWLSWSHWLVENIIRWIL